MELTKGEICLIIALCETTGKLTPDEDKFKEIANKLRQQIGAI